MSGNRLGRAYPALLQIDSSKLPLPTNALSQDPLVQSPSQKKIPAHSASTVHGSRTELGWHRGDRASDLRPLSLHYGVRAREGYIPVWAELT